MSKYKKIITCKKCKRKTSSEDKYCPYCGTPVIHKKNGIIVVIFLIIIIFIIGVIVGLYYMNQEKQKYKMDKLLSVIGAIHENTYELIMKDCSWEEAFDICVENGGHLAMLESKEEFSIIIEELNLDQYKDKIFYLGGKRQISSDLYYWTDEEGFRTDFPVNDTNSWSYGYWHKGEPSYSYNGEEECYMNLQYNKNSEKWGFNDTRNNILSSAPNYSGRIGFICEYE